MAMHQKVKSFTKEDLILNRKNHLSKAELDQALDHMFLRKTLRVSWARQMFKDLMKTWDHEDQAHKHQENQHSQNQKVNSSLRSVVKQQVRREAFSHRNQRQHLLLLQVGNKPRILRKPHLPLKKMLVPPKYKKSFQLPKNRHQLILMKLRKLLLPYLKSSQPLVKLVRCQVRHTFHNFRDSFKMRKMQGKI